MIGHLLALVLIGQDPPYTQFYAEAERLGRASYFAGVCAEAELIRVTEDQVAREAEAFQRRAVVAGAWGPMVESAFHKGAAAAIAEVDIMTADLDALPEPDLQRRIVEIEDFLVDRCLQVIRTIPGAAPIG